MPTLTPSDIPAALTRYVARVRAAFAATLTRQWWDDVAEASVAQAWQVAAPFVALVWATHSLTGSAARAVAVQVVAAVAVVVLRRLAGLTVPDTAPLDVKTAARVVSALAGALAGFAVNIAAGGVVGVDWPQVLLAAVASAGLALLHRAADPATTDALAEVASLQAASVALERARLNGRPAAVPTQLDAAADVAPDVTDADTVGEA